MPLAVRIGTSVPALSDVVATLVPPSPPVGPTGDYHVTDDAKTDPYYIDDPKTDVLEHTDP